MGRIVIAEYDASENTLRLAEPLPDVKDREKVRISIEKNQGSRPVGNVRDAIARLGSLNAPTGDIEQMITEIEAGRR